MSLNLFPARIEIGQFAGADGRPIKVYPSNEFVRALSALFNQLGGSSGLDADSLATLASFASAEAVVDQFTAPQEATVAGEVGALRDQLAQAVALLEGARAESSALVSRLEALEAVNGVVAEPTSVNLNDLARRLEALELQQAPTDTGTDWEHPGKLGFRAANSAAVTTLTASGLVALSPANANVTISPTGTGTVTISPAAALTIAPTAVSTMNNVDIGTATPKTGTFTALNNDQEIRSTQAVGGAYYGMWSLSANVNSRNWALAMQSLAFGQCELVISNARLGDPVAAGTVVWSATIAGLKVTAGFGCNTKTAQASVASGAALIAYAAGANGLATGAAMQALVDKVTVMDTALKANGILA